MFYNRNQLYEEVLSAFENQGALYFDTQTKWKRCGKYIIQMLTLPHITVTNENSMYVCDARFTKFRASKLFCHLIFCTQEQKFVNQITRYYNNFSVTYRVGKWITSDLCGGHLTYFNSLDGACAVLRGLGWSLIGFLALLRLLHVYYEDWVNSYFN